MKFCIRCVMPDTRPGLTIDSEGVCSACRHTEHKKTVDWQDRKKAFSKLCQKYERKGNEYDCLIAVSSGKDSWWQIHIIKNEFHLNPLLINVYNLDFTKTGLDNYNNMLDVFGCECLSLHSNKEINKKISKIIFEKYGYTAWLWDRLVYTYPIWMSIKLGIPLVFYGENSSLEYGGPLKEDTPSAINQINNDVVRDYGWEIFTEQGISMTDLNLAKFPSPEEIAEAKVDPRFMSYYFNWSGFEHMKLAKMHGWKSLNDTGEWNRKGWIDDYNQIDDFAYLVDPYLKYPKLGHRQVTDVCSRLIRDGQMTREDAIPLVREHDAQLDPTALEHYLKFSGYSEHQFWEIVDRFYNRNLFVKRDHTWTLKNPIWKKE